MGQSLYLLLIILALIVALGHFSGDRNVNREWNWSRDRIINPRPRPDDDGGGRIRPIIRPRPRPWRWIETLENSNQPVRIR